MYTMKLSEIARAVGASVPSGAEEVPIRGLSIDSRTISSGELFIALRGERFDGHDYVPALVGKAAAVIVERRVDADIPQLIVGDSIKALGRLGAACRDAIPLEYAVGVTGSVGKTTTKEFITCILRRSIKTHSTPGNFNNHIGLPLTLASLPSDARALVCEMGMSATGEIEYLSGLCRPNIAVVTNIGVSHIEALGTREAIRDAKLEITRGMKQGDTIFLNGDEPLLRDETAKRVCEGLNVVYVGFGSENDIYPLDIFNSRKVVSFDAITPSGELHLTIPAVGDHFVMNALFACGVGLLCGITPCEIGTGLSEYKPQGFRQKIYDKNSVTVIADCYNAGPESMAAALKVLSARSGKRIAVLGDMLELGLVSRQAHMTVGREVAECGIDYLVAYGKAASDYVTGAVKTGLPSDKCRFFSERDALISFLPTLICCGDTVLFKASRRMKLEDIIAAIGLDDSDSL